MQAVWKLLMCGDVLRRDDVRLQLRVDVVAALGPGGRKGGSDGADADERDGDEQANGAVHDWNNPPVDDDQSHTLTGVVSR